MLRAVADAQGSLGENVTLPHGDLQLGRNYVAVAASSNDLKVKVSRKQLLVKFSSENKTCTVTRTGGTMSRLVRADGGERIKISKSTKHDLLPGDTLWIMEHTDGATYGGYVFEPVAPPAAPAAPAAPAPPVVPAAPAAPAAPAPLAPIAAEDSVGTPAPFEKHLLGSNDRPAAGADASGGGDRGSGGKGSGGGGRSRGTCHFCGETGHWASECPKNPNRVGRGSGSRDGGGGGACYECGMTGHYARDCPAPKKASVAAAAKAKKAKEEEAAAKVRVRVRVRVRARVS